MSYATALGVVPGRRPVALAELRNAHGWSPSIWRRLLRHNGHDENWIANDDGLDKLWHSIESLPEWQQVPLVLTFDTGVVPYQCFGQVADLLDEFDRRLPAPTGHANHVPAVAELLRSEPTVPLFGIWGTSVTNNPFDPWDDDAEQYGSGIGVEAMYVLPQHRRIVLDAWPPT